MLVAATRIATLAVICPELTGFTFYSCYAGLWSRLTREGKSPRALSLLAVKTRIWAGKLVSMSDWPEALRHAYRLWFSARQPFGLCSGRGKVLGKVLQPANFFGLSAAKFRFSANLQLSKLGTPMESI